MMSSTREEYTFVCPECDESLAVNAPMKEALIEKGCVVCGESVTTEAFSYASAPDSD